MTGFSEHFPRAWLQARWTHSQVPGSVTDRFVGAVMPGSVRLSAIRAVEQVASLRLQLAGMVHVEPAERQVVHLPDPTGIAAEEGTSQIPIGGLSAAVDRAGRSPCVHVSRLAPCFRVRALLCFNLRPWRAVMSTVRLSPRAASV
jgi:hypothetical protein